jgi:hypothetical protein
MTDEDFRREVHDLAGRVEELEEERERLKRLPDAVARLEGALGALTRVVNSRFDSVDQGVANAKPGRDFWLKLILGGVVPVLVALITGYFLLKAGLAQSGAPK